MEKTSEKQRYIAYSFWSNFYKKPGIAKYYLLDWQDALDKHENNFHFHDACFWMALVEQDHHVLEAQLNTFDRGLSVRLAPLFPLIRVFVSSEIHSAPSESIQLNKENLDLTQKILCCYLVARIELNARRFRSARKTIFDVLSLKKSSTYFEADLNNMLLGLLYLTLTEIELAESNLFDADEWLRKVKKIIKDQELEILKKRLALSQLLIFEVKGREKDMMRLWTIEGAEEWGTITDEIMLCHIVASMCASGEKKKIETLRDELLGRFSFRYAHRFFDLVLKQEFLGTRELLEELTDMLEFNEHGFPKTIDLPEAFENEWKTFRLSSLRKRLMCSDAIHPLIDNTSWRSEEYDPGKIIIKSNHLWITLLEKMQSDYIQAEAQKLRLDYFSDQAQCFHSLNLALKGNSLSSKVFIEALEAFCSWSGKIDLHYTKREWRNDQILPGNYLVVLWVVLLQIFEMEFSSIRSFYTLSTKKNSLDVEFDFYPVSDDADQVKYWETKILHAKDQLLMEITNLRNIHSSMNIQFNAFRLKNERIIKWQLEVNEALKM